MRKRRVVLVCEKKLWGESIEYLLAHARSVELAAWWSFADPIVERLVEVKPDILVIADDELGGGRCACLTAEVMEALPELVVLQATPHQKELRVLTSKVYPASQRELLKVISEIHQRGKGG